MRLESITNLREKLTENKRVFTLSAPTGAGKTMMLLALAKETLAKDKSLSVIYALPFLSITEQVEGICREIFDNNVLRIDSRAENQTIQELQKKLDDEQTDENVKRLLQESFTETTFDHPFIITTFVQVFEALLSNRNATLLRLPNFSKTVFLIDEIQALPYRLYSFFTAFLEEFCRQFDSYAIISTATMPHLDFSRQQTATHIAGRKLFTNYKMPDELLNAPKYFSEKVFNRYRITRLLQNDFKVSDLANHIEERDESCLVILNTIDDTKDLYDLLSKTYSKAECILLNTHFSLKDRRTKIWLAKRRLKYKKKIILISTQLIEAGVDIDFPTVYRDFCPLPSLIQSAGRCNRNGKLKDKDDNLRLGEVFFFALQKENGKLSSELIYRDEAKNFLKYCRDKLPEIITESELFEIQKDFFKNEVGEFLKFGIHKQSNCKDGETTGILNLVTSINKAAFEQLGKFRLIDEDYFGFEFRYYIPQNEQDEAFEELQTLTQIKNTRNYEEAMKKRIAIETKLKEMSARIVTFRVKNENLAPVPEGEEVCKIRKLGDLSKYTFETGIELRANAGFII
ncbi:MAG: CRISPR-associated helicase Cas3' [Pyrinomonadaceae bacterium]